MAILVNYEDGKAKLYFPPEDGPYEEATSALVSFQVTQGGRFRGQATGTFDVNGDGDPIELEVTPTDNRQPPNWILSVTNVDGVRRQVFWNASTELWGPRATNVWSNSDFPDEVPSSTVPTLSEAAKRKRSTMSLQSFQRDTMIIPNHDATLLTLTGDVADITDARWDSKSTGSVNPVFGTFALRSSLTLGAGKIVGFGVFCALADDSKLNVYRLRLGGFALGDLRLVPYVGEPAAAPGASTLVSARAFGASSELLGFNEVVGSNPSESRSFFGGVAVMNPTGAAVTAAVSVVGSLQACHVTAPRMALAVV